MSGGEYQPGVDNWPTTTPTTVGNVTVWPNSNPTLWPTTTYTTGGWPTYCTGNIHVWGCDHQAVCRCGTVSRVVAVPKCGVCGQ